jgi:hypothetical protein
LGRSSSRSCWRCTSASTDRQGAPASSPGGALIGPALIAVGQHYQSGADLWQLFAVWAVLFVPFAWVARSSWGVAGLLVLAQLWMNEAADVLRWVNTARPWMSVLMWLTPVVLEHWRHRRSPQAPSASTLGFSPVALGWVLWTAAHATGYLRFVTWGQWLTLGLALVAGASVLVRPREQMGLLRFVGVLGAAAAVVGPTLGWLDQPFAFDGIVGGGALLVVVAVMAVDFRRPASVSLPSRAEEVMVAAGVWLGATPIGLGALLVFEDVSRGVAFSVGAMLFLAAAALTRIPSRLDEPEGHLDGGRRVRRVVGRHLVLVASFLGHAAMIAAAGGWQRTLLLICLLQVVAIVLIDDDRHRFLSVLAAALAATGLGHHDGGWPAAIDAVTVAAGTLAAIAVVRGGPPDHRHATAEVWRVARVLGAASIVVLVAQPSLVHLVRYRQRAFLVPELDVFVLGAVAFWVIAGDDVRARRLLTRRTVTAALGIGAVGVLSMNAPTVLAGVLAVLLAARSGSTALRVVGAVGLVVSIATWTSHLQTTLMNKALIAGAAGAVLLGVRAALTRRPWVRAPRGVAPAVSGARRRVLAGGVAAVITTLVVGIASTDQKLAAAETVYLKVSAFSPRANALGRYIQLSYPELPWDLYKAPRDAAGRTPFRLSMQNVMRPSGRHLRADRWVRPRGGDRRFRVAARQFFFDEEDPARLRRARYVKLKLTAGGFLYLDDLVDERFESLSRAAE